MKLGTWIATLGVAWLACLGVADGVLADPGKLARAECWFKAPDKISTRCYRLSVPESRAGRSDLTLELPVVVISVPETRKREDPVVYLAGGPGDGAWLDADRIDFWWEFVADNAWVNERDLVLVDQRGTGLTQPRMDCPEQEVAQIRSLSFGLNRKAAREEWESAAASCRVRVEKEGHDPLSYTSRDSATDLHDLMTALKLQQWNVYGLSYGTRLALTYARDYPHDLRSLILDSVYLPESAFLEDDAWRTDRAFRVLFDGCRQSKDCNRWYPDLEQRLLALVRKLNQTPIEREVELDSGKRVKVVVTGELLLNYLFQNLYNRSGIETVPQIIDLFEKGSQAAVTSEIGYLADLYVDRPDWGDALSLSIDCHEEVPFNDLVEAAQRLSPLSAAEELRGGRILGRRLRQVADGAARPGGEPGDLFRRADPAADRALRSDHAAAICAACRQPPHQQLLFRVPERRPRRAQQRALRRRARQAVPRRSHAHARARLPRTPQAARVPLARLIRARLNQVRARVKCMIQLVSQVAPPSGEKACSQRAEVWVISDQRKRTLMGRPLKVSSARKVPTPSLNPPRIGASIVGYR